MPVIKRILERQHLPVEPGMIFGAEIEIAVACVCRRLWPSDRWEVHFDELMDIAKSECWPKSFRPLFTGQWRSVLEAAARAKGLP